MGRSGEPWAKNVAKCSILFYFLSGRPRFWERFGVPIRQEWKVFGANLDEIVTGVWAPPGAARRGIGASGRVIMGP